MIYALDPGYEESAIVGLADGGRVVHAIKERNEQLLADLQTRTSGDVLVIEQIESFGMAVGRTVFETVFWAGRFAQAWPGPWDRLPRSTVKLTICRSRRANDSEIRQAIIDRYGPTKELAIGTKAAPGPLYGFKSDLWAALALGLTYQELARERAAQQLAPTA